MNNKGFTLVELIVVIALLGIITALTSTMLIFSNDTFESTTDQQTLQSDARLISTFIERELEYASNVEILSSVPSTFDSSKRYIYLDDTDHRVKHKTEVGSAETVRSAFDFIDYDLEFSKKSNTVVWYQIDAEADGREFSLKSDVEVLNLKGIKDTDKVIGSTGKCIVYGYENDANTITSFIFEDTNNDEFTTDMIGNIIGNLIEIYVPHDTSLTDLTPTYVTTGVKVEIGTTEQQSGVTENDYSSDVIYTVTAANGDTRDYIVRVIELPETPPNASNVRIVANDKDGNVSPTAWSDGTLEGRYTYIPNGNGDEGATQYKWQVSDTENGTYTDIAGETTQTLNPSTYSEKWIKFLVKPIAVSGAAGPWVESDPMEIYPGTNNPLWKKIVEDLWYINATEAEQNNFNDDYGSDYEADIETLIMDTRNNINSNAIEQSIRIDGDFSTGNLYFGIDAEKYVEDPNSFKINFDTILFRGDNLTTWGWGIGFNSYIYETGSSNNAIRKDEGYLFQFDPGAYGFVVRRNDPSHRVIKWMGARSTSTGNNEPGREEGGYGAPYRPTFLTNEDFKWTGTNDKKNKLWWLDYSTEIIFQKQLDESYIVKAQTWEIPEEGEEPKKAEPMWFGDFSGLQLDDGYIYNGVDATDPDDGNISTSSNTSLSEFREDDEKKTYIGFRSWGNDTGNSKYDVKFNKLELSDGFKMSIEDAYFFDDQSIIVTFDQEIRDEIRESYDIDNDGSEEELFEYNKGITNPEILSITKFNSNSIIITLKEPFDNLSDAFITIKRGGVRQLLAGDIRIDNGEQYLINKNFLPFYSEEFDGSESLDSWVTSYRGGSLTYDNNGYVVKQDADDPGGGYLEFDQTYNKGQIISAFKIKRLSIESSPEDRISISGFNGGNSKNVNGYGIGITPNEFKIEERNSAEGITLVNDDSFVRDNDQWYRVIFTIDIDSSIISASLFNEDGDLLSSLSVEDDSYDTFNHFFIHGGQDFAVDDIVIGLIE